MLFKVSALFRAFIVFMVLVSSQALAKAPVILVVGDSISAAFGIPVQEGWVALLEKELQQSVPDLQVVNASISGDTTQGGLTRLPALLAQHKPSLTIIELGGNDGLRGTPIKYIKQNLRQMIELAQLSSSDVLLLGMQIPPNYGPKYTGLFKAMYPGLAKELSTELVPFLLEGVANKPELMQDDGIHPKAQAQHILFEHVRAKINLVR